MQRTCVKCGHNNPRASGTSDEACPQCGAIYAKARLASERPAARTASSTPSRAPSGFGRSTQLPDSEDDNLRRANCEHFVLRMRAESLYPTVRTLVKWGHWITVAVAGAVVFVSLRAAMTAGPLIAVAGFGIAILLVVFSLAARELSLMVADLADASVRSAAVAETGRG